MSVAPIRQLKQQHGFQPYEHDFIYTGAMEAWTVPSTGVYLVELWGGSGGSGSAGAYVKSYHKLNRGTTLYIGVGGTGTYKGHSWNDPTQNITLAGGFNGGGDGNYRCDNNYQHSSYGGGGGATHLSKENVAIPSTQNTSNILCVAGGGGAGGAWTWAGFDPESGSRSASPNASSNGVLGKGTNWSGSNVNGYGAGGGGRYGGNRGCAGTNLKESYGSYTATETQGINSGNGKAKITRVE